MLNKIKTLSALMLSLVLWFVLVLFGLMWLVLMLVFDSGHQDKWVRGHESPGKEIFGDGKTGVHGVDRRLKYTSASTSVSVNALKEPVIR